MTTLVNNMSPAGNTNQAIGLAHGWMSLVDGGQYDLTIRDDLKQPLKRIFPQ